MKRIPNERWGSRPSFSLGLLDGHSLHSLNSAFYKFVLIFSNECLFHHSDLCALSKMIAITIGDLKATIAIAISNLIKIEIEIEIAIAIFAIGVMPCWPPSIILSVVLKRLGLRKKLRPLTKIREALACFGKRKVFFWSNRVSPNFKAFLHFKVIIVKIVTYSRARLR